MTKSEMASDFDKKILSILSEHTDKKLLSFGAGITIVGILLIHPSPQKITKAIVSQRCLEDLILLFNMVGPAVQIIKAQDPKLNTDVFIDRDRLIFKKLLPQESPDFDELIRWLPNLPKNHDKINLSVDNFLAACDRGIDVSEYISSHPDLLSFGTDFYLLRLVFHVRETTTEEEFENYVNAIWELRELLAVSREKFRLDS